MVKVQKSKNYCYMFSITTNHWQNEQITHSIKNELTQKRVAFKFEPYAMGGIYEIFEGKKTLFLACFYNLDLRSANDLTRFIELKIKVLTGQEPKRTKFFEIFENWENSYHQAHEIYDPSNCSNQAGYQNQRYLNRNNQMIIPNLRNSMLYSDMANQSKSDEKNTKKSQDCNKSISLKDKLDPKNFKFPPKCAKKIMRITQIFQKKLKEYDSLYQHNHGNLRFSYINPIAQVIYEQKATKKINSLRSIND